MSNFEVLLTAGAGDLNLYVPPPRGGTRLQGYRRKEPLTQPV